MHDDRGDRSGAKQPGRFDPAKAARLDAPERLTYLPPERIAALLGAAAGIVLDFGAGTGSYALPLARLLPDTKILALDEQPEMLALLRAKLEAEPAPNVLPLLPAELPAFSGTIDRVLAINVLHEIGDRDLAAIPALMAPGGRALFIDWNADVERPVGPPAEHVYGAEEARERLARFGFQAEQTEQFAYHYAILCKTGS